MHADELDVDAALVRRLLVGQFPEWDELPLERVPSSGTENALFRLGTDMVVRLPRVASATAGIARDFQWLPLLAPRLPVAVPVPLARGLPAEGYPWPWGVYPWLEGTNPTPGSPTDAEALANDAAAFVAALHAVDLRDGPPAFRGILTTRDDATRAAIAACDGLVDTRAVTAAWESALDAPGPSGAPVWVHGDLLPGNLLVARGRLAAVIDWSGVGLGDEACDLIVAWAVLPAEARPAFRAATRAGDAEWARGRGWALSIALIALPYYKHTNREFADLARHIIREVLAETD